MALVDRNLVRASLIDGGVKDVMERMLDVVNPQAQNGITAFATGGQASATQLTKTVNRISTCATLNDSVKLPAAKAGDVCFVVNSGAAAGNVFPQTGETINALAANTALAIAVGARHLYFCTHDGAWFAIVSA